MMIPGSTFPKKVFINGEIVYSETAKISIFDRGFLFGDGIYEVMVQLENGLFYRQAHMSRMQRNLDEIGIAYDVSNLERHIPDLLHQSQLQEESCMIYMQVTRGIAPRKHAFPSEAVPTVMMYALPYQLPKINQKRLNVVSIPDERWHRCDIKSISLLGNVMANQYAIDQNANETILVRDGLIAEGSHTNIFFVKGDMVYTHPANNHILDGITRKVVIHLCEKHKIPLEEKAISLEDISSMDEAFLTGTTTQVAAVEHFNNHTYNLDGEAGPITKRLQKAFAELKKLKASSLVL